MKTFGIIVCIFLYLSLPVFAQVDTTVWYPLNDGDYWEYVAFTSPSFTFISIKVIGDTVYPTGKTYKKVEYRIFGQSESFYYYERFENNKVYMPGRGPILDSSCTDNEVVRYDFTLPDSSIWPNCSSYLFSSTSHRGLLGMGRQFISIFSSDFSIYVFHNVHITASDTVWDPLQSPEWPVPIAKGIGKTGFVIEPLGFFYLSGAILNNTVYGTITGLNNEKQIPPQHTFEIYPNPSNNEVKISYRIVDFGKVTLLLYDILGNEVMTIEDTYQPPGNYTVPVYTYQLSSGVYFASMKTGNTVLTKKLIFLK